MKKKWAAIPRRLHCPRGFRPPTGRRQHSAASVRRGETGETPLPAATNRQGASAPRCVARRTKDTGHARNPRRPPSPRPAPSAPPRGPSASRASTLRSAGAGAVTSGRAPASMPPAAMRSRMGATRDSPCVEIPIISDRTRCAAAASAISSATPARQKARETSARASASVTRITALAPSLFPPCPPQSRSAPEAAAGAPARWSPR